MHSDTISYQGIDEAVLLHALYHGTQPLGMGILHNKEGLTLDEVRADLATREPDRMGEVGWDYYRGRPLKLGFNLAAKTFRTGLYDRDAGQGAAQRIVDRLRTSVPA